jgi:2-oxoisovalerate dehydrogenase E2 component (dihydrolipoyl transacylase)
MAKVGKPFVDIDIYGDAKREDLTSLSQPETPQAQKDAADKVVAAEPSDMKYDSTPTSTITPSSHPENQAPSKTLAVPATRFLCKQHGLDINEIPGTGKDGRVTKEDVHKFMEARKSAEPVAKKSTSPAPESSNKHAEGATQQETSVQLTPTQLGMFKTMTRSLTIPHFLYADEVDVTSLSELRSRLNKVLGRPSNIPGEASDASAIQKLTFLPFILKAVSLSLYQYPILNARVEIDSSTTKPSLVHRSEHNIGVAMDTPQGLVVPVIRSVNRRNLLSIAGELGRLHRLAQAGKLSMQDMTGGTITVSNIGSVGGTYLSPVIVEREVAILGMGRVRTVPAFDGEGRVIPRQVCNFSWSADHRVVDGATLARAAGVVRQIIEEPDVMVMQLR